MDKNRISNHNWICRTLTGTIALEEIPMPLKQRNFLKHLAKPVRVSEFYKILKEKYPNDYNKTSDFVQIVSFTNKKLWIEKVEKPQLIDEDDNKSSYDSSFDDSRDSSSLPEELLNLSKKAQSGYSEESGVFEVEFEDPEEKEDIKKWFDEADDYEEPQVEFIPDEQTKELILKLGLGTLNDNNLDELEIPEENPFVNRGNNIPKTEAANQVLNMLNQFNDINVNEDEDESNIGKEIKEDISHQEESINFIFNQKVDDDENKEPVVEQMEEENNIREISNTDRETKRQERLNKRNTNTPKKNETKKEQGLFGSLKNGIKKIIGK